MNTQLLYYIRPVELNSPHTDEELLCDLLIRIAFGDQLQYLAFPVGQGSVPCLTLACCLPDVRLHHDL